MPEDRAGTNGPDRHPARSLVARNRWLAVGIGALILLAGTIAIVLPALSSLAFTVYFGLMIGALGVFQIVSAVRESSGVDQLVSASLGVLAVATGLLTLFFPLAGALSLTLILGVFFLVDGLVRLGAAITRNGGAQRTVNALGGSLSLALAAIILLGLPGSATYTLGLIWGVHAVFVGVTLVAMALFRQEAPGEPA